MQVQDIYLVGGKMQPLNTVHKIMQINPEVLLLPFLAASIVHLIMQLIRQTKIEAEQKLYATS